MGLIIQLHSQLTQNKFLLQRGILLRVTGAYPVTTDLIAQVNVGTASRTAAQ